MDRRNALKGMVAVPLAVVPSIGLCSNNEDVEYFKHKEANYVMKFPKREYKSVKPHKFRPPTEEEKQRVEEEYKRFEKKDVEKESDIDVESKRNDEVINLFVSDSFPKDKRQDWGTPNLRIVKQTNGWALINYATPIMYRNDAGELYFNTQKYSQTTSKIQNQIRQAVGGSATEVDEGGITQAISEASSAGSAEENVEKVAQPEPMPTTPPEPGFEWVLVGDKWVKKAIGTSGAY